VIRGPAAITHRPNRELATAPVSHQKRPHQNATNAIEPKRNHSKINEAILGRLVTMSKIRTRPKCVPTGSLHQSEFGDRIKGVDQAQRIAAGKEILAAFEEGLAGFPAVQKPGQELAGHLACQ
jgi:hypothetical protein